MRTAKLALCGARRHNELQPRDEPASPNVPLIRDARNDEVETMRRLLRDYESSIGVDLCFQNFEDELEKLPGEYAAAAKGALLVADNGDDLVGCVALRAFSGESCVTFLELKL
jgi:putative acetyltransferase